MDAKEIKAGGEVMWNGFKCVVLSVEKGTLLLKNTVTGSKVANVAAADVSPVPAKK